MNLFYLNSFILVIILLLIYIFIYKQIKTKLLYSSYKKKVIDLILKDIKKNNISISDHQNDKYVLGFITNFFVTYMFKKKFPIKKQKQLLILAFHHIFENENAINIYMDTEKYLAKREKKFVQGSKEGYNAAIYLINNKNYDNFLSSYIKHLNAINVL